MPELSYDYEFCPTIGRFSNSDAFMRGLMGPVGAGKSSGCVAEIPYRAMNQAKGPDGIRRSRWIVVRNTFRMLEDTTIRTFHQWLPPEYFGRWYAQDHRYVVKSFPQCEFEVLFRALDRPQDIRNLLSLELTGGWVNEARETPWAIIDALQSRVGRYPAAIDGGCTWSGIWMDTNPPDTDSEWYDFFENERWRKDFDRLQHEGALPPGIERPEDYAAIFKQPSGFAPNAENLPNLTPGYYSRQSIGKRPEWIKVYLEGDYGYVTEDKTVFPEYRDNLHLRDNIDPVPRVTIERNWDFGLCYDDLTEVLTADGWKFFADVDCDLDRFLSRDPVTHQEGFAKAAFKIAKPFQGEMLEWAGPGLNICVTPEHRVPFTFLEDDRTVHWTSAREIADDPGTERFVYIDGMRRAALRPQDLRRTPYDGTVYCLNVPHHTLYVRRGGKPSWNGNTPACTFSQMLPSGQWLIFDEMIATGMGIDRFSDEVLAHCGKAFRGSVTFDDIGDPAGEARAQTDERTCFDIMHAKGIEIYGGEQNIALRLESLRKPFLSLAPNGEPRIIVHQRCKKVRKAFMGSYYYRRLATNAERYSDEPEKNHPYSDLMDGLEYRAVQHFGGGLTAPHAQDDYPTRIRDKRGRSTTTGY